jgi:hypothetical protein
MKRYLFALVALSLSGCATTQETPEQLAIEDQYLVNAQSPLTCADKAQCDLYWQRAEVWIAKNCAYRVHTENDNVISTYGPDSSQGMAYIVTKTPDPDGSSTIDVEASNGVDQHTGEILAGMLKTFIATGSEVPQLGN